MLFQDEFDEGLKFLRLNFINIIEEGLSFPRLVSEGSLSGLSSYDDRVELLPHQLTVFMMINFFLNKETLNYW